MGATVPSAAEAVTDDTATKRTSPRTQPDGPRSSGAADAAEASWRTGKMLHASATAVSANQHQSVANIAAPRRTTKSLSTR